MGLSGTSIQKRVRLIFLNALTLGLYYPKWTIVIFTFEGFHGDPRKIVPVLNLKGN